MVGKRDWSSVKDPAPHAGLSQREAYRVEDGGFHDENVRWVGFDYIVDQARCLAQNRLSLIARPHLVHWRDASVEEIEAHRLKVS